MKSVEAYKRSLCFLVSKQLKLLILNLQYIPSSLADSMLVSVLTAFIFLSSVWAAPAGVHEKRLNDPPNVPTKNPTGPPGASGSLRGGVGLRGYSSSNPVSLDSTEIPPSDFEVAPGTGANPDLGFFLDLKGVKNPQPLRGSDKVPTDPGPRNYAIDRENSDAFAPPGTDTNDLPNSKWPMGLSANRHGLDNAGWARQQNTQNLPVSKDFAGVDMRLEPNAYRELHWHKANEWALMLNGSVRIAVVNEAGESFVDDLQAGDVWFFVSSSDTILETALVLTSNLDSLQESPTAFKPWKTDASFCLSLMRETLARTTHFLCQNCSFGIRNRCWQRTYEWISLRSTICHLISYTSSLELQLPRISARRMSQVRPV